MIPADEPTGNLNSEQGEQVMGHLKTLDEEGTTIVQVTHSESNVRYAGRVIHLLDRQIVGDETV